MIFGVHTILYSSDAEADRSFLRDVLGFTAVDAGRGWLIFALPPGEVAVHPTDGEGHHELYLMCDDVNAEVTRLQKHGVECDSISQQGWGRLTHLRLPSGARLGLYEPQHPMAIGK